MFDKFDSYVDFPMQDMANLKGPQANALAVAGLYFYPWSTFERLSDSKFWMKSLNMFES